MMNNAALIKQALIPSRNKMTLNPLHYETAFRHGQHVFVLKS